MKSASTKSHVSNAQPDPSEEGFSISLGRFEICPFGTVIDSTTGATLGRIQYMRRDSRSAIVQAVLSAWGSWLAASLPAHARRAA